MIFELANEHYGIDIAAVEGIVKMQEITAVPNAPDYVEGVTNLRNSVLPVIDLEKRFGIIPHDRTRETRIVVPTKTLDHQINIPKPPAPNHPWRSYGHHISGKPIQEAAPHGSD